MSRTWKAFGLSGLLVAIVAALTLGLAGCGDDDDAEESEDVENQHDQEDEEDEHGEEDTIEYEGEEYELCESNEDCTEEDETCDGLIVDGDPVMVCRGEPTEVTIGDETFDICESDEDCSGFELCEGEITGNGEPISYCKEVEGETGECDPVTACEDYCYHKAARCMEETCQEGSEIAEQEEDLCNDGLGDGQGAMVVEPCVDVASATASACHQIRSDADDYASQSCDDPAQEKTRCVDALVLRLENGEAAMDACGCEAASTAATCTNHGDCASYGNGTCEETASGTGYCTANCYDFNGNPPSPVVPDPTCGDNGACLYESELEGAPDPDIDPQCVINCTSASDCDDGYCLPYLGFQDGGSYGICDNGYWSDDVETCDSVFDCSDSDGACIGGLCYDSCSEDSECGETVGCNQVEGHCEPDFQ